MAVDRYSRFVNLSKVTLPLVALVLLSTLFLLSRDRDPVSTLPFAENDLRQRLADQQLTGPVFSSVNSSGDEMTVSAESMRNRAEGNEQQADFLNAEFDLVDGTRVTVRADDGEVSILRQNAVLSGNVVFETSRGSRFTSDHLTAEAEPLLLVSPGPVVGTTPFGSLNAGSMRLTTVPETEIRQLFFTNGVKLLYQPDSSSE